MLEKWISKYPTIFAKYPDIDKRSSCFKARLNDVLALGEACGAFVTQPEKLVTELLEQSVYQLSALNEVISCIQTFDSFNAELFIQLCTDELLVSSFKSAIKTFEAQPAEVTANVLSFLLTCSDHGGIISVFAACLENSVELDETAKILSEIPDKSGLVDAILIFDCAGFRIDKPSFAQFKNLANFMANPLANAIFEARLRVSGSQSVTPKTIDKISSEEIIKLASSDDFETSIEEFFAMWTDARAGGTCSQPRSQFDWCDEFDEYGDASIKDTATPIHVLSAYNVFIDKQIMALKTSAELDSLKDVIQSIKQEGGTSELIKKIKYQSAANIVNAEWYNDDDYPTLMGKILAQAAKPQIDLVDFKDELITKLEAFSATKATQAELMNKFSLLKEKQDAAGVDAHSSSSPSPVAL